MNDLLKHLNYTQVYSFGHFCYMQKFNHFKVTGSVTAEYNKITFRWRLYNKMWTGAWQAALSGLLL